MKLSQLLAQCPHSILYGTIDIEVTEITTDSRTASAGSLFVALTGLGADGHNFIENAIKNGASVIVAERETEAAQKDGVTYVVTDSTPKALSLLSRTFYGYPTEKMRLVGVTGTNGKTTTTQLIKQILDSCGYKTGLIGTNRHMIGDRVLPSGNTTPEAHRLNRLFAEMAEAGVDVVVMEVSSHALELHRLTGARFAVGAFTNLTRDHLDFHGTMENYMAAKAKLFSVCDIAVINTDDPCGAYMCEKATCPCVTYGIDKPAAYQAQNPQLLMSAVSYDLCTQEGSTPITVGIPGRFSVYNSLTAIAVCSALGVSMEDISVGLKHAVGVVGRAEVLPLALPFTVLIDYAHTPDGLENILNTVRGFAKKRIITVFGCGGNRDKTKRPIMGAAVERLSDLAVVTSDNPRLEEPDAIIADILSGMQNKETTVAIADRRAAISYALSIAQPDDVVVLCGKGHETYQDIGGKKNDFDERKVAEEEARALGLL